MNTLVERCAGIDVGKRFVMVCVLTGGPGEKAQSEVRKYGTTARTRKLAAVAHRDRMYTGRDGEHRHVLEASIECAGERVIDSAGKRETRQECSRTEKRRQRLSMARATSPARADPRKLHSPSRHSESPDLTRRRRLRIPDNSVQVDLGAATAEKNRIQKVLEDANIKLGTVLGDVFGASGRAMLAALVNGEANPEAIAELARCVLRKKIPQIRLALTGCVFDSAPPVPPSTSSASHRLSSHANGRTGRAN